MSTRTELLNLSFEKFLQSSAVEIPTVRRDSSANLVPSWSGNEAEKVSDNFIDITKERRNFLTENYRIYRSLYDHRLPRLSSYKYKALCFGVVACVSWVVEQIGGKEFGHGAASVDVKSFLGLKVEEIEASLSVLGLLGVLDTVLEERLPLGSANDSRQVTTYSINQEATGVLRSGTKEFYGVQALLDTAITKTRVQVL